jgi:hypothetical protein
LVNCGRHDDQGATITKKSGARGEPLDAIAREIDQHLTP